MSLVGLVRVSTAKQETVRQNDALNPISVKVFEEKVSGKLKVDELPGLKAALEYLRGWGMLVVQDVDRLGHNMLEGLIALDDLFERGVVVKVLEGTAVGEHSARIIVLDIVLALVKGRRRDISRKTKNGLEAVCWRGKVGGRLRAIDDDKRAVILAPRDQGESIRVIAHVVTVTVNTVRAVLAEQTAGTTA